MNVADKIANWLVEKEISHVFGIIGSANMGIWNSIAQKEEIKIVCCHHESAAATASDFFNRTSGRLKSVCLVTAGAGSSNALTGVLASYMDSTPLMVISGQENTAFLDRDYGKRVIGVQGFMAAETAFAMTKRASRLNENYIEVCAELDNLYRIATTGRKGPVWLDIPRDLQVKEC